MTISIWRYSHLVLAVSSFLFLALASLTGILLSFEPISEKLQPYRTDGIDTISIAQTLPVLRNAYPGITEVLVDANDFVQIKGSDAAGKNLSAYIDPLSGKILGVVTAKSAFFEWVTALHRSLFLHEAGRFFVGLTAFLLLLITISGTILIIQRQRGLKRFFTRIQRDHFEQYYHVVLGRLSLIPIFILALTGTYLSLDRFGLVQTSFESAEVDFDAIRSEPEKKAGDFAVFRLTKLSEVQSIEFPFSEDAEDYYILKLKDRELAVNQITGDILSETIYPVTLMITRLSLDLHTGRGSSLWAIILAIASGNILFFIYSGFAITLKRRGSRVKNKYHPGESEFIILVGSENGSTFHFASAIHRQLIAAGKTAYLAELNDYAVFPAAKHLIVFTATYGLGDAPTNAAGFKSALDKHRQTGPVDFSVVGFGSHNYPDFCKFAFEINNLLSEQDWASPLLEIHTVNDKSPEEFGQWASAWSQVAQIPLSVSAGLLQPRQERLQDMYVTSVTGIDSAADASFLIRLQPKRIHPCTSGDLLAIYPAADHRERLYSIGKIGKEIQLSVKLHPNGLGSGYLSGLKAGDLIRARVIPNPHFHLPAGAAKVVMVSNGTGIAPFLGMIDQLHTRVDAHLYCGFRGASSFALYKEPIEKSIEGKKLKCVNVAYSREGQRQYVRDLLKRDEVLVADVLASGGVLMLCGSLSMQNDVIALLDDICQQRLGKKISHYQSRSQVLMDCY
jgi:sulfite reductase (NADPH) flavoprotein alpha-component